MKIKVLTEMRNLLKKINLLNLKKTVFSFIGFLYRKPIKENTVIPFSGNMPFEYKTSAFRSFIKRAFLICSDDILNKEIEFIQKIAFDHGFPAKFVNKIVQ